MDQIAGLNGDVVGNPNSNVVGAFGGGLDSSLQLDGDGDYISIPDDGSLSFAREMSVSLWINADSVAAGMSLLHKSNNYSLLLNTDGSLRFSTSGGSAQSPAGTIQAGQWYHLVATMDRDTQQVLVYVDGQQVAAGTTPSFDSSVNSSPLLIGRNPNLGLGAPYNGRIDEVSIYGRALSPEEVVRQTFARASNVTVELVDATSGDVVETIVSDRLLPGRLDWTIPANVPVDQKYRIRVTQSGGTTDTSDGTFQIANNGTAYYVNLSDDIDFSDNEYTTAAGDNLNTGKSPDSPMSSIRALIEAYDLDAGDTIYVDSGYYRLLQNIVIDASDSGVTIQGAQQGSNLTVLDRSSTSLDTQNFGFHFIGADDVTLSNLSITGGLHGVFTERDSGSVNNTLRANRIYDNFREEIYISASNDDWTIVDNEIFSSSATNSDGVFVSSSHTELIGNSIHDHASGVRTGSGFLNGIRIVDNDIFDNTDYGLDVRFGELAGQADSITGNRIFGNLDGILVSALGSTEQTLVVRDNDVFDNSRDGIIASANVLVIDNQVHDNLRNGITVRSNAIAKDNTVYSNETGITGSTFGQFFTIDGNRIYDNSSFGILTYGTGVVKNNAVYSNSIGIAGAKTNNRDFEGGIVSNLVYDNTNTGIRITDGASGADISNNTVFQAVGEAIRIETSSQDVRVHNNILWVDSGHNLFVGADSLTGLSSDRNLFHQGTDSGAFIGFWGDESVDTLAQWQSISGGDTNSQEGDPLFIDRNGADNIFGYDSVSDIDGGRDDNFILTKFSPAIDSGLSWGVPREDIQGTVRRDDPDLADTGSDDYRQTVISSDVFDSPSGTGINLRGGIGSRSVTLPFSFPFYGSSFTSVNVSVDGLLQFGTTLSVNDTNFSRESFITQARISALWDNLRTSGAGNDIFVDQSVTDQITIRWNATNEADGSDVNFAVRLFASGEIEFHYGDGNTNLTPTVGISAGDGQTYQFTSLDGQTTLTQASATRFALQPGQVDIGAYEFRGQSNDSIPPTITGGGEAPNEGLVAFSSLFSSAVSQQSGKANVHNEGVMLPFDRIGINFSEELNNIDAVSSAGYELRGSGPNQIFDDGDDVVFTVSPLFELGDASVTLMIEEGYPSDWHVSVDDFQRARSQSTRHCRNSARW